jgi:hypothetical protein
MARPRVADGGTASNMEESGQPKRGGPAAWGLGELLTTPHRRTHFVTKCSHRKPRT